ncbi:MAG: aspartate--ammonia ligase, partial [Clostridia bacterium]|nr:aspartate--ammonia ligase [Clostridia bacterium]
TLREAVRAIVNAVCDAQLTVRGRFPTLGGELLERNVFFITSQELEDLYPDNTPKERETLIVREKKTVFIEKIGGKLKSGKPHDGRAPDYDDWDLNGDIFFYHAPLDMAMEISSMGIRVDAESLSRQLRIAGCEERRNLPFHRMLLANELPLTMGGGIGQSRLCMLLLGKAHIGEVQSSIWDQKTIKACEEANIQLL